MFEKWYIAYCKHCNLDRASNIPQCNRLLKQLIDVHVTVKAFKSTPLPLPNTHPPSPPELQL
ncbi:hypothetical protein T4B_5010 [Trichinella pseudospiralis]|uniref:Uncharacterized protein n=2 Tax=Trichinella pseudospiralis TaxID=6337 RepID=A0A0V1FGQ6_TRIPS|nr:hypothetical protein T4A_10239 [Trichinella pseudospiralis]KRY84435.1 hypothetical protein T4D_8766 [Trichinella pseudospiralis]KRZ27179.1 hypothetical protein T4B_5010 [Trichinella pseudospiralis]KRZ32519.1 hypothetical protein T4C_576 [Trichinella pseudospiralis]